MSISVECPGCEKKLKAKDELAGKRVKCPNCGQVVIVPSARSASQQVTATNPSPKESPPRREYETTLSSAPPSRPVRWPWYAGGGAALLCVVAVLVFIFAMPRKDRTSAKNEMAAVTPTQPQLKPEPQPEPKPEPKPEPQPEPKFETNPPKEKPRLSDTSRLTFTKEPTHKLDFADPESVTFSPDDKRLIVAGANSSKESVIMAWDTARWKKEREVLLQSKASHVEFTPDQKRLVLSSGKDDKVHFLDPLTFQLQNSLTAPGIVISFAISPDGKTLATTNAKGETPEGASSTIQLWDLATHKVSRTLADSTDLTTCIVYSPDGKYLASTGKRVRIWSLATGRPEKMLTRDQDTFACFFASFSPDNTKLAGSCNDGQTCTWDVASGQLLDSFKGDQENVFSVRFSPDGRTLMTRSMKGFDGSDRTSAFLALAAGSDVVIWNVATRSKLELCNGVCVMEPHSFAFSPNGQTVVAKVNKGVGVWIGNEK